MRSSLSSLFLALLLLCLSFPASARRYTVVVSLDGFRWDYPLWYDTPFLDFMAREGASSGLIPSFPSKTFPNHYTLATGLYPDHHGIVANEFYDPTTGESFSLANAIQKSSPSFYGGEPIWNTAHRQGRRVSVFYWPGSDVKVNGRYPDKYLLYDQKPRLSVADRLRGVVDELRLPESQRPDLIMAYSEQPDANGHNYGPQSKQTRAAVVSMDSLLQVMYHDIRQLPIADSVNIIVVSDHGMTWIPRDHVVSIGRFLKKEWVRMASGSVPCNVYTEPGYQDSVFQALQQVDHVKVWRKQDIPHYLHYGSSPRVGDIVVCPDEGFVVYEDSITAGGTHGFDPTLPAMHALFRAVGPDFRHAEIPHFKNVDIYPLLCRLLGIRPAPNDGNIEEIETILHKIE
ncbi:MAG: alkaline phosphatase family protein [Prevotella sp.]|nr:alkaline phosphatase family protein [Prevotella sp.]